MLQPQDEEMPAAVTGPAPPGGDDLAPLTGSLAVLPIPVLQETLDGVSAVASANGWDLVQAARTLLHYGLSGFDTPALAHRYREHPPEPAPGQAPLDPVERLLADSRAMYATMKYHAFKLQQQVQAQELQIHGLQGKAEAWEHWADQMRTQVAQLQAENAVLRAQLAGSRPVPTGAAPVPSAPRTVWARLREHLQGGGAHAPRE